MVTRRFHTHVVRILDQGPARLAPGGVSARGDVRLQVGDGVRHLVLVLLRDRIEVQLKCVDKPFLRVERACGGESAPETAEEEGGMVNSTL